MADYHGDAESVHVIGGLGLGEVGARNGIARRLQDFGDAGHPGATNTDEMKSSDSTVPHGFDAFR